MITDRIGQHEVLIPINRNYDKICEILGFFINLKHKKFQVIFLLVGEKQPFKVSVKENEVPTEKYSRRASIFATKASYILN